MGRHWLKHNWLVATIAFVQQGKILGRGDLLTITSRNELIALYYQHPGHDPRWNRVMVIKAVASYAEQDSKVAALITAGLSDPERLVRQEARRSL
jgi:hypothetical protein